MCGCSTYCGYFSLNYVESKVASVGIIDRMSKKHTKLPSYIFVAVQLVLFGLLIFLPTSTDIAITYSKLIANTLLIIGILICLIAIWQLRNYSLTALPAPVNNAKLLTTGLYKYVRRPIYTGVMLAFGGVALGSQSTIKILLWLVLVAFFIIKSRYEEGLLIKQFPGYKTYQSSTGRFLPKLMS